MRLEYMTSSTLLIQFAVAGRAEFRPASYRSKPCGKAADFRLGAYDDPVRRRRILRGSDLRTGHRVYAVVPASPGHRARRGRVLGRCDHVVLERGGASGSYVVGCPRVPARP